MSQLIKPLRAWHYNREKITDMSAVVCPPYDTVSPRLLRELKKRSRYNFINVTLIDKKNGYDALAKRFGKWLDDGIFIQDEKDCIYMYEQQFTLEGKTRSRFGFLALLKLDKEGVVFPHENTLSAPKKDRFNLLKKIKVNMSPIFVISDRTLKSFAELSARCHRKKTDMDFYDSKHIRNRVWRLFEPALIKSLSREVSMGKLFIADGHHRFAVARRYFKKYKDVYKDLNYMLAYFTDSSSGLLIMPTHRIARLKETSKEIFERLAPYFHISEVSEDFLRKQIRGEGKSFAFGICAKKKFYFLSLKNKKILDTIFVKKEDKIYKSLDVSILHKLVLKHLTVENIEYSHKIKEVKMKVSGHKIGFLLRATPLKTVFDIARKGRLLPQKSTYFYPKLLSGIVVRRFQS